MGCTYKFATQLPESQGVEFTYEAGSIEELLETILNSYNKKGKNFKKDFLSSDFLFYDTGVSASEAIDAAKKSFVDNKKILNNTNTVTHVSSTLAYGPTGSVLFRNYGVKELDDLLEILYDFRRKFGTVIHEIILAKLEDKPSTNIINELETILNEYNRKISPELKIISSRLNQSDQELFMTLSLLHEWSSHSSKNALYLLNWNHYIDTIQLAADAIKNHYTGGKIYSEIEISLKKRDSSPKLLYGKSDLIVEKPDGTIVIVDFKTSLTLENSSTNMSDSTKLYHFALLEAYRKILESHGYKAENILAENLLITFNRQGISFDINDPKYVVNPEDSVSGKEQIKVRKALAPYFPVETVSTIDKNTMDSIVEKLEHFCSGMMLKRWQLDSLKSSLLIAAKNKNYKYIFSIKEGTRLCKLEIVGNKDSDNPIIAGFVDTDSGPKKVFEKDLESLAMDELNSVKEETADLAEGIFLAILDRNPEKLREFIKENRIKERRLLWGNLYKYCSENYSMVECPELLKLGIIVVKHLTRGYELIVLTSESSNLQFSNDPGESILKGVFGEKLYKEASKYINKYKESKEMLRPSIGNIYGMRALIALADLKDKIETFKDGKLIGINVVSMASGQSTGLLSTDLLKKTSMVLQQVCRENTNIEHREHFTDIYDKIKSIEGYSTTELWELMLSDSLLVCAEEYGMSDSLKWDLSKTENIELKLQSLNRLLEIMEENPKIKSELAAIGHKSTDKGKVGAENESSAVRLYLLIKAVKAKLRDNLFIENSMNNVSINYQEAIVNGINLLTKGSIQKYTKNGLMLTGLALGLTTSNAYASPSKLIQRFLHFYDVATGRMLKLLQDELTELNKATEKFIEKRKKSSLIDKVVGNHNDFYKGLFALDESGKISRDMLFLNPYSPDCKLTSDEKEYLEIVLWTLNRRRMHFNSSGEEEIQSKSYSEFKKTELFETYKQNILNNPKFLEVPLKLREGASSVWSGLSLVMNSEKSLKDFGKLEITRWRAMIEREFLDEHLQSMKDKAILEGTYYNYFEENSENRATRTENKNPEDWEWNVNALCVEYTLADLKLKYFRDLLSVADDLFAAIAIIEDMTGLDLTNLTEELFNRLKISIYNKTLMPDEWKDIVSALGLGKSAMALTKIAVRPTLLFKELILGRIRNTAAILADQIHQDEGHEISMKHLTDAALEVFGANFLKEKTFKIFGKYPAGHKSIADKLNDTYAINDRDLSVIGDKFSYDSYGLHNFAARMLYINTIAPDWFNRMIIFIAKMKADGCYEAHSINEETGELEYDITKDERVNYYWANRHNPNMNDEKFLKLKAYFIEKMRLFELDGWRNRDFSELKYGDQETDPSPFPRAYTTTEEESIKELIGLIYGYYSHQERATYLKGLWYNLQTAFLTFLPAEVRKALATGRDTSIYVTRLEKDLDGNLLYWKKSKEGELTEKTTNKTDPDTGEFLAPVMETVSDPYVGTVVATAKVIGLMCNKDFDSLKRDPRLVKLMEIFLFNFLFAILISTIFAVLSYAGINSAGVLIAGNTLKKVANELEFYHAVIEPVSDFNLVGVDFLNNTFASAFKTISSENYSLLDFANENFAIVKDANINAFTNV